jgi:cephalosporin-C deacetylase-like acetyl esterase
MSRAGTAVLLGWSAFAVAGQQAVPPPEYEALQAHFERVTQARFDNLFTGVGSSAEWEGRRQRTRQVLERMLWHDRRWPPSPPRARITGRLELADCLVENLVLETDPGLYLTANLYLPRKRAKPYPAVLYQCGHASKTYFRRHGAWMAARGIAVLVMDNIEMGEIQMTHHGVYAHAWFHWYSRGFSPLAVELWNARRALDYLETRPDIDRRRIGATGRSGGGMATFFLAALDERVKASAPVSGTLSTLGWVRRRLTAAHCDCQYPVNSHGLLYSEIGALVAPRAQLLVNADADRGFPMDAFGEMVAKIGEVYRLYGASANLRTAVTPGGHADTEAIRLPVHSFFLKELLGIDTPVEAEGPVEEPPAGRLTCFADGLPLDERLSRADELFLPTYEYRPPADPAARTRELVGQLRAEVFRYFPAQPAPLEPNWGEEKTEQGRLVRTVTFQGFEGLRVRAIYSLPEPPARNRLPAVLLVDHRRGIPVWGNEQPLERGQWGERAVLVIETIDRGRRALEQNLRSFNDDDLAHHMRRQAMVAGTTIESMQLYEILRSLEFLRAQPQVDPARITVTGRGPMGVNGLYAALLDGGVERVVLGSPPESHRHGPVYLGVLRYTDIPEVVALLRAKVDVYGEVPAAVERALGKRPCGVSLADCLR